MSWLTLVIASVALITIAAVLLRHPGVVLYDWFAARRTARHAAARAALPVRRAPAHAAEHAEPAPSVS